MAKETLKKMKVVANIEFLQNGKIFEKVGVNFSKVYGKFPKKFQKKILGAQ
jgi:coproporphyrinogen III oxidase